MFLAANCLLELKSEDSGRMFLRKVMLGMNFVNIFFNDVSKEEEGFELYS